MLSSPHSLSLFFFFIPLSRVFRRPKGRWREWPSLQSNTNATTWTCKGSSRISANHSPPPGLSQPITWKSCKRRTGEEAAVASDFVLSHQKTVVPTLDLIYFDTQIAIELQKMLSSHGNLLHLNASYKFTSKTPEDPIGIL